MATRNNLSRTLEGGHEPFYDFPCSLCGDEGRHVESALYCEECLVYMCDPCVKSHNRIPLNRRHTLLDQGHFTAVSQFAIKSFPTKRCSKHSGELVNIFCGNHDIVCCSVCKALDHSSCNKTQDLSDAAKGIKTSTEYQNIRKESQIFLSDLNKLLDDRKADISRIDKEKLEVKRTIADFRKKANKYLDILEQKSLNELDLKETSIINDLEKVRQFLDYAKKEAEDIFQRLDSFTGDNECELFFQVKTCKCFIKESTERVEDISPIAPESVVFKIDESIEKYLSSIPTLGWFDGRHSATVQSSSAAAGTSTSSANLQDSKGGGLFGQSTTTALSGVYGHTPISGGVGLLGSTDGSGFKTSTSGQGFGYGQASLFSFGKPAFGQPATYGQTPSFNFGSQFDKSSSNSRGGGLLSGFGRTPSAENTNTFAFGTAQPFGTSQNNMKSASNKFCIGATIRHNRYGRTGTVTAVNPDGTVVVKWDMSGRTRGPYTVGTGLGDVSLI